jgi:endonuclease YncB( thermonuclease family)
VCLALLLALPGCQPASQSMDGPGPAARSHPSLPPGRGPLSGDGTAQVLRARSLQVQDGDSFIARTSAGIRRTVRVSGIDAPERYQPHADQSRQNLRRLLADRDLDLHVSGTDQYGRAIAQVFTVDAAAEPVDVGLAQIEAGMAWFFRRYQRDLPRPSRRRYADAELGARKTSKGLWQEQDPEPPWDFRRRQRAVTRDRGR